MSNVIIVEAENDATFIKRIVKYMNERKGNNINIDNKKGYTTLNDKTPEKTYRGLSEASLTNSLKRVKKRLEKEPIEKVGIIIDMDQKLQQERLDLVNKAMLTVFSEAETIININQLVKITKIDQQDIQAACYFMNVNGKGELATVLKKIKTKKSIYADCIESWKTCIINTLNDNKKIILSDNDFDKLWVYNYIYYDISNKEYGFNEKGFKIIMDKQQDIWNFDHPILEDLKLFLALF
ncbi:DUF3226 domain-containing protein [Crocosphaera chwakensis]|uniref:DUF4435 domain-containing protein n=1 Tax=Crocosphaera chwakensis CCY0110 TaxID=391612 RepID=A3ILX6_9CHRO|nr:DUF3226 domain-containing protein [Crocosphaera chwakensis]EAZ92432.1 hypothetical protein CY0110_01864 [Crocosphaera chwakensis CCY0110]